MTLLATFSCIYCNSQLSDPKVSNCPQCGGPTGYVEVQVKAPIRPPLVNPIRISFSVEFFQMVFKAYYPDGTGKRTTVEPRMIRPGEDFGNEVLRKVVFDLQLDPNRMDEIEWYSNGQKWEKVPVLEKRNPYMIIWNTDRRF